MQSSIERPAAAGPFARSGLLPENLTRAEGGWPGRARTVPPADRTGPPLVHVPSAGGRFPAYLRLLERSFGARPGRLRDILFARAPVLFLAVEESFLLYIFAGLLRALIGRRTVGLLLRPLPLAVSGNRRCRWRRAVLGRLRRIGAIRTLTALPFDVFPAFAAIADGWIHDFQLWDLTAEERTAVELLRETRRTGGRLVLTAIGAQDWRKGFDLFSESYVGFTSLRARFRFIACGKVAEEMAAHAAALRGAGGVVVDRVISDAELLGAYAASDAVWCLYPPAGDHACGIFGRAAQLGLPVVVRQGSLCHRLCLLENIRHVAVTANDMTAQLAAPLPPRDMMGGRLAAMRFARHSKAVLRTALGLAPSQDEAGA